MRPGWKVGDVVEVDPAKMRGHFATRGMVYDESNVLEIEFKGWSEGLTSARNFHGAVVISSGDYSNHKIGETSYNWNSEVFKLKVRKMLDPELCVVDEGEEV